MLLQLQKFSDISQAEWDGLAENSDEAWLYQTYAGIKLAESHVGLVNLSFGVRRESGDLLAACPLFLDRYTPTYSNAVANFLVRVINFVALNLTNRRIFEFKQLVCDPEFYSGPFVSNEFGDKKRKMILKFVVLQIENEAKLNKVDAVRIRLAEPAPSYTPGKRPLINPLAFSGINLPLTTPQRFACFVELSAGNDFIWKQLDEDARAMVNKARRSMVRFDSMDTKNIARFHEIHKASWDRTMGRHHEIDRFQNMLKILDIDNDSVNVFFATKNGADLATAIIHTYKDCAYYFAGASFVESLELGTNVFLLYSCMEWAEQSGKKFFFVGLFDAYQGKNKKSFTVGQYKKQFSKNHVSAMEFQKFYSKRAQKEFMLEISGE